ncbi:MAG: TIGR03960 family B12-binding radical SAM protein [Desulfuromonadaceae bacterium]|nr:TIGR03960 family B12-binding radical SAM protein [Desulfuromonadaceae bacterium]
MKNSRTALNTALLNVKRPGRYLGGEAGSVRKDPAAVDLRFALAFPDVYEIGMSHVGSAILYQVLNQTAWIAAERAYCPWPDMGDQLRENGVALSTLESDTPLAQMDIVGFSLQYELCYTNVLHMLDLAGIPRRHSQRSEEDPLILVGGPCAFNPEPLADFIDAALLGDGEEAAVEICQAIRDSRRAGESRQQCLERLSRIEGVYVPHFFSVDYQADGRIAAIRPHDTDYPSVRRRFVADLDSAPFPERPLVPSMHTVHNRVALEIARGCTRGCRFCQAGYIYRPVRERQAPHLAEIAHNALCSSGYDELSLLSLSSGDYSAIEPLLQHLMARRAEDRIALSLPSLRVGSLTDNLIEEIRKVRKTGFTLAPEAGSERLRQVINKGIEAEELIRSARTIYSLGWRVIKLYFMMGLPTETAEDLAGIVELSAAVKRTARGTEGGGDVNVSVSTFVPKAHTPFQWEAQIGLEQTVRQQQTLREQLQKKKLRLKWHEATLSLLEGVFARGDRRLGALLERAVDLGCRFDGWRDHFRFDLWQQAMAECHIDSAFYLRQREEDEVLPWDHLDCGIPKAFFLRERRRSRQLDYTPDCRHGQCSGCGICDFEQLTMRYADATPVFRAEAAPPTSEPGRYKLRLRMAKTGNARFISHLEFMTVVQRALRRMNAPLRYSQGFHPHPRLSFPDALPTGVESRAELVDIELIAPRDPKTFSHDMNAQLPEGFAVLNAEEVDFSTPAAGSTIRTSRYVVTGQDDFPPDLALRVQQALAADSLPFVRQKDNKPIRVDLRPDIADLCWDGQQLTLDLHRGSPVVIACFLLGLNDSRVRSLGLCKTEVTLEIEARPV